MVTGARLIWKFFNVASVATRFCYATGKPAGGILRPQRPIDASSKSFNFRSEAIVAAARRRPAAGVDLAGAARLVPEREEASHPARVPVGDLHRAEALLEELLQGLVEVHPRALEAVALVRVDLRRGGVSASAGRRGPRRLTWCE